MKQDSFHLLRSPKHEEQRRGRIRRGFKAYPVGWLGLLIATLLIAPAPLFWLAWYWEPHRIERSKEIMDEKKPIYVPFELKLRQQVLTLGEDPSPRQYLLRAAGYPLFAGTFFLGFLWPEWTEANAPGTVASRAPISYLSYFHALRFFVYRDTRCIWRLTCNPRPARPIGRSLETLYQPLPLSYNCR